MEAHPDVHLTHDELAEKFGIAKTTMKRCYESLYGKTVYADLKHLRFTKAVESLRVRQRLQNYYSGFGILMRAT